MGFWSTIGNIGASIGASLIPGGSLIKDVVKAGIGAGGAALGAAGQASATNRGEKFGGQLELERLLMDRDRQFQDQQISREQEGRAGSSDAWRKMLSAEHLLSPGARPQLSKYSIAPRQSTDTERQGASALSAEVMARLMGGNPIAAPIRRAPAVDPKLLNAGGFETFAGIASPALTIWSQLAGLGQKPKQTSTQVPNAGNV
jgi:hypothetical protein